MGGAGGSWDAGYRTSDEVLATGRDGLAFFQRFIRYYDQAAQLAGGGRFRGVTMNDLQRPYDELRGIDFSMFRVDAEHLRTALDSAENHQHNLDRYWASLSGWTGDASNAARAHRDRFDGMAANFLRNARDIPGAIAAGTAAIQDNLVGYTTDVRNLAGETCGGMTPEEVEGAIRTAMGDIEGAEAARFLAKAFDFASGFSTFGAGWLLDYFGLGASDQVERAIQQMIDGAKQALRAFIAEFDAKKAAFDAYTQSVQQVVQRNYDMLLGYMRPMSEEAFRGLNDPSDFRQPTTPQGTVTTGPRPGTPPRPPGAPGTQPSGTVPSGVPTPTRPPTPVGAGQGTQPSGTGSPVPGVPPVPGATPPIAPTPRPGIGVPPTQPQPVTIRFGNGSVTLTPPDAQGRMRLTINDGVNPPKTYDLDLGRGSTSASGVTPPSGVGGTIPPLPPATGIGSSPLPSPGAPGLGIPPVGAIGATPGAGGRPGAQPTAPTPRLPSSLFPWSDTPAETLQPDEDGKVVIKDGEVTITVDSDELTDQLTLTVDDGQGNTTSYTVDYKDPAHPTLREGAGLPSLPEPAQFGPTGFTPASSLPTAGSLPGLDFAGSVPGGGGGAGGFGGGGGGGIAAGLSGGAGGLGGSPSPQLEQGAYTGGVASGQPAGQSGGMVAAQSDAGAARGGGMMGGAMPMGAMGAAGGQGGEDKERGGNKWIGGQDVISEDSEERRRAVKAGGVIGEDRKK